MPTPQEGGLWDTLIGIGFGHSFCTKLPGVGQPGGEKDPRGPALGQARTLEELQKLTVLRAYGRDISLDEFSLAKVFSGGEMAMA